MKFYSKKSILGIMVIVFSLFLISCATEKKEITSTHGAYHVSGDRLSLDTTIKDTPEEVKEIVAKPIQIDKKSAEKILVRKGKAKYYGDKKNGENIYENEEGDGLSFTPDGLEFYSNFYFHLNLCFRLDPRDEDYNGDKFSKDKDFDFMTRKEALEYLKSRLKEMGVELGNIEYQCYALDYKTLKKYEYAENSDGKEDKSYYKDKWTKEDNCYCFTIRQKINDIIEYHFLDGVFRNYEDCNSSIIAVVSKNGIESLQMYCALSFENTGKKIKILNPQEILDKVSNSYGKVISDTTYTITDFGLCYMTDVINGYSVTPIYQCHIIENSKNGKRVLQLLYNAETGEELR